MPASANEHGVNRDDDLAPAVVSDDGLPAPDAPAVIPADTLPTPDAPAVIPADGLPTPDAPAVIPADALPAPEGGSPERTLNDLPKWLSEPDGWDKLTEAAQGIVSLQQAKAAGVARKKLHQQARSGKGQRVHRGVYATFAGELTRTAELWAAISRAGRGAMLSHETAAEIQGLSSQPSSLIHITVPTRRRPAQRTDIAGVVIHRSDQAQADPVPYTELPRTRLMDTVLDLVATAGTFEQAYTWIARAVSLTGLTTTDIAAAMAARTRMRRRKLLAEMLGDVGDGVHFPLEHHYLKMIIREHGLPAGTRQPRQREGTATWYLDFAYPQYKVVVELDGAIGSPPLTRAPDALDGSRTIKLGWPDVIDHACANAARLARILTDGGWDAATLRPCGDGCEVAPVSSSSARP